MQNTHDVGDIDGFLGERMPGGKFINLYRAVNHARGEEKRGGWMVVRPLRYGGKRKSRLTNDNGEHFEESVWDLEVFEYGEAPGVTPSDFEPGKFTWTPNVTWLKHWQETMRKVVREAGDPAAIRDYVFLVQREEKKSDSGYWFAVIHVEIVGSVADYKNGKGRSTQTLQDQHADPAAGASDEVIGHVNAIREARSEEELKAAFSAAWRALSGADRKLVKGEYDHAKAVLAQPPLDDDDIPL